MRRRIVLRVILICKNDWPYLGLAPLSRLWGASGRGAVVGPGGRDAVVARCLGKTAAVSRSHSQVWGTTAAGVARSHSRVGTAAADVAHSHSRVGTAADDVARSHSRVGTAADDVARSHSRVGTAAADVARDGHCGRRPDIADVRCL